ncbi:MAG: dihydrodipicolinate synthase family protein [Deltaproteobacteria bacterium]
MSESAIPFASVFVAAPTPFDDGGAVDDAALIHITDYLARRDVAGIALLTEAAEDAVLTAEERTKIVERVHKRLAEKKSTIVSISAVSTREAVDLARHAEQCGTHGILLALHRIPGLGYRELYRHLDRVSRAVTVPTYLSLRSDNAADCLTPEELATLGQHERLAGVFVPDAPAEKTRAWAKRMKAKEGTVFAGCALTFPEAARSGANAVICGVAMLATEQSTRMMGAVERGDVDMIRRLEKKLKPGIEVLGPPRPPGEEGGVKRLANRLAQRPLDGLLLRPTVPFRLIKKGLQMQGHPVKPHVRPPFEEVGNEEAERFKTVLRSSGIVS